DERGGYHLVWPRDLVECAGALLALGAQSEARDTLRYLIATQTEDGHWNQNQWLGGTSYWTGIQLDETGFPVLLATALADRDAPPGMLADHKASAAFVPIRNQPDDAGRPADQQIGTEFLQLVRFGLRRADDPLILGSLRLADALLKTDTPNGPVWHRYLGDGYG